MINDLEEDIAAHGWDAGVDGAICAMRWVLGDSLVNAERALRKLMERPENECRADWLSRGGNPADWPQ